MRHTELWSRMDEAMGRAYARGWAEQQVLADLDGRTVDEALADGVDPKTVWRAVWAARGLPDRDR